MITHYIADFQRGCLYGCECYANALAARRFLGFGFIVANTPDNAFIINTIRASWL